VQDTTPSWQKGTNCRFSYVKLAIDTAGKERHRRKLNCVGLALINAIISTK